jgi:ribonuclease HII
VKKATRSSTRGTAPAVRNTLGIDEAGRGPVIGPMVLAAVALDSHAARRLTRAGLRDSKAYASTPPGRAQRSAMALRVLELARFAAVRVVDVAIIDRRVRRGELNVLEREIATDLIGRAPTVDRIVTDGKRLFGPLSGLFPHLEAWDRGEERHAAVAAASVLAKVRRDEIMARIATRYQPMFGAVEGGGYVNARTRAFLCEYARRFGRLPPEARRSWPHWYLADVLGPSFDPYADVPDECEGQLRLL